MNFGIANLSTAQFIVRAKRSNLSDLETLKVSTNQHHNHFKTLYFKDIRRGKVHLRKSTQNKSHRRGPKATRKRKKGRYLQNKYIKLSLSNPLLAK